MEKLYTQILFTKHVTDLWSSVLEELIQKTEKNGNYCFNRKYVLPWIFFYKSLQEKLPQIIFFNKCLTVWLHVGLAFSNYFLRSGFFNHSL